MSREEKIILKQEKTEILTCDICGKTGRVRGMNLENMKEQTGIDLSAYPKIKNKRQVLRNMFEPELGKFIFDAIFITDK